MEAATNAISERLSALAHDSPDAVGQGRLLIVVGLLHEPCRTTQGNAAEALIHVARTATPTPPLTVPLSARLAASRRSWRCCTSKWWKYAPHAPQCYSRKCNKLPHV